MSDENVFGDYETFHDVGYSLTNNKISYTDYIHDERFEILGCALAIGRKDPEFILGPEVDYWYKQLANPEKRRLIGHNEQFDGYITTQIIGTRFGSYFDTMGMIDCLFQGGVARNLDGAMKYLLGMDGKDDIIKQIKGKHLADLTPEELEKLTKYAIRDCRATQGLFYGFAHYMPRTEWQAMDIFLKMFVEPILEFDETTLELALKEAVDEREEQIQVAVQMFGCTEDDLRSDKFQELLASTGEEIPMKPSPSVAGKMIPAFAKTDEAFQALLECDNPAAVALCEARVAVKSTQGITRAERFLKLHRTIGKCPVGANYYKAHTGRITGSNKINLTNLKRGSNLRKSVVAPPGHVLVVVDSSQIECRDSAYLAGQQDLLEEFRTGRDPYNSMASKIFGRPIDRKNNPDDELPGFIGKTARLGLQYQMGGPKFQWTAKSKAKVDLGIDLDMPLDEAYRVVEVYRRETYRVADMWSTIQGWLQAMVAGGPAFDFVYPDGKLTIDPKEKKIWFPNGTYLYYPGLEWRDGNFVYLNKQKHNWFTKKIYGGLCFENIVQKHSRDIVVDQMLQIAERYKIVLHSYDENVAVVPEREADEALEWMINIMKTPPSWAASLPLGAEGGYAREYSK